MGSPSSYLIIFSGVPLDNTYDNTFSNSAYSGNRLNFFKRICTQWYDFDSMMWIRHDKNKIRVSTQDVGSSHANVYPSFFDNFNYLMFVNKTSAGANVSREYYCFITDVNYINDNTVEFVFEIDVMATYYYDWSFGACYVEREHVDNDDIGNNIEPEPVGLCNDYIISGTSDHAFPGGWSIILLWAPKEGAGTSYQTINGQICCCSWSKIGTDNTSIIPAVLERHEQDVCVMAYYIPTELWDEGIPVYRNTGDINQLVNLDGYRPKNKKLYTYPYSFIEATNSRGSVKQYKWEDFNGTNQAGTKVANFKLVGSAFGTPSILFIPTNYKNMGDTYANIDECLSLNDFGSVVMRKEGIGYWDSTHEMANNIRVFSSLFNGLMGGGDGAAVGARTLTTALAVEGERVGQMNKAAPITGFPSSNANLYSSIGEAGFKLKYMSVRYSVAEKIDNFFTRYGYAVNKVKIPNMYSRTLYNYIKTRECILIDDELPAWAAKKICDIHNKGITYWHTQSLGNFTGSNPIRSS